MLDDLNSNIAASRSDSNVPKEVAVNANPLSLGAYGRQMSGAINVDKLAGLFRPEPRNA